MQGASSITVRRERGHHCSRPIAASEVNAGSLNHSLSFTLAGFLGGLVVGEPCLEATQGEITRLPYRAWCKSSPSPRVTDR